FMPGGQVVRSLRQPGSLRATVMALLLLSGAVLTTGQVLAADEKPADKPAPPVSFYRQVRPILQRNCTGCHQPAKDGGKLVLTSYEGLKQGGENGAGFEAGKPDESNLLIYISGEEPEMPRNADPLKTKEVDLISRWITEGATD